MTSPSLPLQNLPASADDAILSVLEAQDGLALDELCAWLAIGTEGGYDLNNIYSDLMHLCNDGKVQWVDGLIWREKRV